MPNELQVRNSLRVGGMAGFPSCKLYDLRLQPADENEEAVEISETEPERMQMDAHACAGRFVRTRMLFAQP